MKDRGIGRKYHKYQRDLLKLLLDGMELLPGVTYRLSVKHQEQCGVWRGLLCDCDCTIRLTPWVDRRL